MFKRAIAAALCLAAAASLASCGKDPDISVSVSDTAGESGSPSAGNEKEPAASSGADAPQAAAVDAVNYTKPEKGDKIIIMNIKDYGEVRIRLFPEYADKGVENFIGLAEKGYYDGLTFHRVINDFMIQGGDPEGTGMGGESIWGGEFDGGSDPHLINCAGALVYANSGSTATDGSQFYIVTGTTYDDADIANMESYYGIKLTDANKEIYKKYGGAPWLDGQYTVFGQVYSGLDVVFKVSKAAADGNDKPYNDIIMESVKVGEYDGEEVKFYPSDYDMDSIKAETIPVANFTPPEEGDTIVEMNIKDYGTVKIRFFPEYADKGVENFIEHAKEGYYDGLTFHRVINDFMIQGGDPEGNGTGGESIWGGKFDGGTDPHLIHAAGAVAYANSGSTATNGSQFYIVTGQVYSEDELTSAGYSEEQTKIYSTQGGTPFLDGSYTVFGQVYDGLDVVFEIQKTETDDSDKPVEPVVIESMKVGEYDGGELRWYMSDYK